MYMYQQISYYRESLPIGSMLKRLGISGGGRPPAALGAGGPIMMSSRSSREETLLLWKEIWSKFKLGKGLHTTQDYQLVPYFF